MVISKWLSCLLSF